jgi:hypothetical protein
MRQRVPMGSRILACAACLWLAGCSWDSNAPEEEVTDAAQVDPADEPAPPVRRPAVRHTASPGPAAAPTAEPSAGPERPAALGMTKSVVQHLRQQTSEGWSTSRSALDVSLTIAADETGPAPSPNPSDRQQGVLRYLVRFQRIRLQQEVPGELPLSYDSDLSGGVVPPAARPYQGLKENGFRFSLNRDRQLVEVTGYDQFLDRCLLPVAPDERAAVRAALPVHSPTDGLAFFVDESIGLIPPEVTRAGDTWMRTTQVAHPVPIVSTIRYTLQQMTADWADVELTGTFGPPSPSAAPSGAVQVFVRGGRLAGESRVDRRSGLPVRSRVDQSLEMMVRLEDGTEFEQVKSTVATLTTDPNVRTIAAGPAADAAPPARPASQMTPLPRAALPLRR